MVIDYSALVAVPTLIVFIFCYFAMNWSGKDKVGVCGGALVFTLSILIQALTLSALELSGSNFPDSVPTTLIGGFRVFGMPIIAVVLLMLAFKRVSMWRDRRI
ncbi:hypothetical protein HBO37_21035 [Pseudomonas proteolytica]|uniref:hypothetical protein n=1 Tax=Pseudomonas proteolytica TaxID=219574 RepID=UPI001475724F|nr:hypothetical protein [Pseudomonas proteolytica]NMZ07838.1 hypothetical protein [Pseudomonas proteolytica]